MRLSMILAGVCLVSGPAAVWADWEYTRWGMTPEQVAAASKGAVTVEPPAKRTALPEANRQSGADGSYDTGGLRLRLRFQFDTKSNGLVCVFATVADAAQNDRYRDLVVEKHGPPQKKAGLAVIGQETFFWSKADEIRLEMVKGHPTTVLHCKPGFGI